MPSILIATEAFTGGGLETHIRGEIRELTSLGWKVSLACGEDFRSTFLPEGLAQVYTGLAFGPTATAADLTHTVEQLARIVREDSVSFIHAHPYLSLIPTAIAAEISQVPLGITVHGPALFNSAYGHFFDSLLDRAIVPSAARVFGVSPEVTTLLEASVPGDRIVLQPNAVPIPSDSFAAHPARKGRWLLASRLDRLKLPGLLEFVRYAMAAGIEGVDIAGHGPAEQDLARALESEIAKNYVGVLGERSDLMAEMPDYQAIAGMGRVVLEALSLGLPACLVGYDGVKGMVNSALFDRAARSNFSGRNLRSVSCEAFSEQIGSLNAFAPTDLVQRIRRQHSEPTVWSAFSASIADLPPNPRGFLQDLYQWLSVLPTVTEQPYLSSPEFRRIAARLARSPKYASSTISTAGADWTNSLFADEASSRTSSVLGQIDALRMERAALVDAVADRDRQVSQIEQELDTTRSALKTAETLVEQLQYKDQARERRMMELSDWAASIDRRPIRHALAKGAVTLRQSIARRLPVSAETKRRLRGLLGTSRLRDSKSVGALTPAVPDRLSGTPAQSLEIGRRDFVILGVIDWHFRFQRPQQLARSLAALGHRVFYVSNEFIDHAQPGFEIEVLPGANALFQVRLRLEGATPIYFAAPSHAALKQLQLGIGQLFFDLGISGAYAVAQHPYWAPILWALPNSLRIYDCMDHHEGFGSVPPELVAAERQLLVTSDLVVTTSQWLMELAATHNPRTALIRNAVDYDFFASPPDKVYRDAAGRRIIGYYGAIAEWFDLDIVKETARVNPEALILLVGNDTIAAQETLGDLPNIRFTGEVPYSELPFYLYAFDVALLPFRVIPLTIATNPVKVYEYLAAGRRVVATKLPELAQFGPLVDVADSKARFAELVRASLAGHSAASGQRARDLFAKQQTWAHRAKDVLAEIQRIQLPRISVVILTYNNLDLTRACLESVISRSNYPNLEIIVVDNHSTDGTAHYLESMSSSHPDIRIIFNEENVGFAAGNNVGLAAATGEYLALLNNDTVVTDGWCLTLLRHLQRDPGLGLVGPVTNNIGNEARIEVEYDSPEHMDVPARAFTLAHMGTAQSIPNLAFFCVMMPRSTYEACGPICTEYATGFFEDDDYCRRVEAQGLRIGCAEDVFIHHHLSASFSKMGQVERQALFERNRRIYESKWGPWVPHSYRA